MRTEAGAAGREETLPCLSWTWLLGWLLKKSLSPHSGKKLRHFLPGDAEPTTFEESTGRKLTVVNQSKNCQQRKTRGREKIPGMREIPFGGTQICILFTSWYRWHARSRLVGTCDLNTVWMQHRKDYSSLLGSIYASRGLFEKKNHIMQWTKYWVCLIT